LNIITSPHNNLVKKLKSLSTGKGRKRFGEFIAEGNKFVLNIPKGWEVAQMVFSESYARKANSEIIYTAGSIILSDHIFSAVSDTVTPSGVIAVVKINEFSVEHILSCPKKFIVLACNLQDPGNMGTLIRTANAAGASGVIVSKDSVDIWSPKVVRATAGSLFNIPITTADIEAVVKILKNNGYTLIAADLSADKTPYQVNLKRPLALMIGNEANGLCNEIIAFSDIKVKLPMFGDVESLNASIASGILMYEVLRQRMET